MTGTYECKYSHLCPVGTYGNTPDGLVVRRLSARCGDVVIAAAAAAASAACRRAGAAATHRLSAKPTAAAVAAARDPVVRLAAPAAASPSTGDPLISHTLMIAWLLARLAGLLWLALAAAACKKRIIVCRPPPGQPPACRQGVAGEYLPNT
ncbi:uncharacterized protein LOC134676867 [Cydia fagiglandana]|uniref:uncharacterized protein LOC134676867 n=1 Tax=Cydia fagiglandana TaxID=1458189 RepID=UPI002FEDE991